MSVMRMSLSELKAFTAAVDSFYSSVNSDCQKFISELGGCHSTMNDSNCRAALKRGAQAADDVRKCAEPVGTLLERLRALISTYESQEDISF